MQIKPTKIIVQGCGIKTAEQLVVVSDTDNLVDSVTFRATLLDRDGAELVFTHITLDASNYASWDATSYGAHVICANLIGVSLT